MLVLTKDIRKKARQSNKNFLNRIFFIEIWYFYSYIAFNSYRVYLKFMTVQINYKNSSLKTNLANLILFVNENFDISGLKKYLSKDEYTYISDLLKTSDLKKNLLFFEIC